MTLKTFLAATAACLTLSACAGQVGNESVGVSNSVYVQPPQAVIDPESPVAGALQLMNSPEVLRAGDMTGGAVPRPHVPSRPSLQSHSALHVPSFSHALRGNPSASGNLSPALRGITQ